MPTYDYRIEATGDVIEVKHTMALTPKNWGELCQLANISLLNIPPESKATKLLTAAGIIKSHTLNTPDTRPCAHGGDCPSGGCE
ncbi:MAG: regulator [Neptuniibacter sp. Phe_28]|nr:MAG: regulator [Neptuniibacter sp. Phe_28]